MTALQQLVLLSYCCLILVRAAAYRGSSVSDRESHGAAAAPSRPQRQPRPLPPFGRRNLRSETLNHLKQPLTLNIQVGLENLVIWYLTTYHQEKARQGGLGALAIIAGRRC